MHNLAENAGVQEAQVVDGGDAARKTLDQVKSELGDPDKIVKLGPKEIYVYKDIKVVFTDGKVSDVQ